MDRIRFASRLNAGCTIGLLGVCVMAFAAQNLQGDETPVAAAQIMEVTNADYLDGKTVKSLEATPESIALDGPFDYAQVVLTAVLESGERVDVTRIATVASNADVVSLSNGQIVHPAVDGDGEITFALGGATTNVRVAVRNANVAPPIEFITDVMPIFSRAGCNAGTCHGAQAGKNGFKLSLRGYDPLFDHRAFTDDHAARRSNRAAPEQSLMLLKSTGQVPHEGGVAIELDSPYYQVVRQWIAEGTRFNAEATRVASIEIWPTNPIVAREGMTQQFRVVATLTDGATRDVTREAFLESGDTETATADRDARLTAVRRGEAPVLARYEGRYAATTLTVMGDREGFAWNDAPAFNFIDELVDAKLKRLKVAPGELCSDADFVRRVYLDLTGIPPTAEETRAFLADPRPIREKRDATIDALIGSPAYVEHRTNKWADLLQVNGKFLGREGATAFRDWIRKQVEANTPYDEFARAVLTASGSNRENPAASYYKILREPEAIMENTTHLFLGVRFNCNKCHDHPFERWTQDQYYEIAAYFAQTGLKKDPESGDRTIGGSAVEGAKPLYEEVYDKEAGEIEHVRTGAVAPPSFPYVHDCAIPADASRREQLAAWITAPTNRYFARSFVNRQWAYLMGVGIIEPIDDIRAGNPPTNPELLDRLTESFIDSGFNTRELIRLICKSRTYQLSVATSEWNADDQRNFAHALARRLPAEVLLDSVHRVTGSTSHFPGLPPGTRAAQLPDVDVKLPGGFLDDLGRPPRESACECERSNSLMLGPVMKLVNGPAVADAIVDPDGEIKQLEASIEDDRALVEELFLRILNRPPSEDEAAASVAMLTEGAADVEWAKTQFAERQKTVDARLDDWISAQQVIPWSPLGRVEAASTNGAALVAQPDLSILAQGPDGVGAYVIVAYTDLPELTGLRLEALADERLPNNGPGRAGNFVLNEITVTAAPMTDPGAVAKVKLKDPEATFSQNGFSIREAVDGDLEKGWAIHPESGKDQTAVFRFEEAVAYNGGTRLTIVIEHRHADGKHALGRFRLSVTGTDHRIALDAYPADIMAALRTRAERRNDAQKEKLIAFHRQLDEEYVAREQAAERVTDARLVGAQDLTWALINSPAFLFNR